MNKATKRRGNTHSNALKAIPAEIRNRCLEPMSSKKDSMVLYQYFTDLLVNMLSTL
jgi:hypothetical protein